jgi:hypothetical protein
MATSRDEARAEAKPTENLQVFELLDAAVLSAGFDNSIGGGRWTIAWDSQSGASAATVVAYGTVPKIVPETRQNSASRANSSQLARSLKWKRVKDLRGKTKMS